MASSRIILAVAALLVLDFVTAADVPFLWARPFRLVGTPDANLITPVGNSYGYKPITLKAGDNLVVTYNKTPHILVLGTKPGDASLGTAAPEGPGGATFTIPFKTPGKYVLSDTYPDKEAGGKPYWQTTNAFLEVTVTAAGGARRLL